MFKKFVKELLAATTKEEISEILYRADGVDIMYQKEKIKWDEHEILFDLAGKMEDAIGE